MRIHNGGSDKDSLEFDCNDLGLECKYYAELTGNDLPPPMITTGNQVFIAFTSNGNAKGFSASFVFGKKVVGI